ncbi:hypothetical protein HYH03_018276 [Edaphochlamys debaryana]|uniref:Uncharacterized protein n=1 Tax=Edaphochlamys debaryana TaxID=47281 RepID=A0A835XME0_9CHLO|nr:hypothetical protein HYH03_018276 [Edaphochlamys debaryana]|eukprot:KAG2482839.1 hypothetical protein HYH03_018276 [Edaphochlamys debaryana]
MLLSRGGFSSALRREHGWPRPVTALPRPAVHRGPRVLRPLALASASRVESSGVESTGDSAHDGPHAVNGPSQLGTPADHPETPAPPGLDDGTGDPPSSADGGSAPGSGSGSGSGGGGRSGGRVALRGFGFGGDRGPRRGPVNAAVAAGAYALLSLLGGIAIIAIAIVAIEAACVEAGEAFGEAFGAVGEAFGAAMTLMAVAPIAAIGAMCTALVDGIVTASAATCAAALAYLGSEVALEWWEAQQAKRAREPRLDPSGRSDAWPRRKRAREAAAAAAAAAAGVTGAAGGGAGHGNGGEAGRGAAGEEAAEDWAREARRVALQTAAAFAAAAGVFAVRALTNANHAASVYDDIMRTARPSYGSSSRRRSTFGDALSDPGSSAVPSAAAAPQLQLASRRLNGAWSDGEEDSSTGLSASSTGVSSG